MVEVVAEPHVRRRRLRHDGLQSRVRVEHRHDREPRAVAGARDADPSIVTGYVGEEPFDGVVGIGALVDALRVLALARLPEHDEGSLRVESSSNVLHRDEEALGGEFGERCRDAHRVQVAGAIGRSQQQNRQRATRGLWRVHLRVEPLAVTHRNHRIAGRQGWWGALLIAAHLHDRHAGDEQGNDE